MLGAPPPAVRSLVRANCATGRAADARPARRWCTAIAGRAGWELRLVGAGWPAHPETRSRARLRDPAAPGRCAPRRCDPPMPALWRRAQGTSHDAAAVRAGPKRPGGSASTTPSCSCWPPAAPPSRPSTRSAAGSTTWSTRSGRQRRGRQAGLVAARSRAAFGPAQPPGDAGADALAAGLRHRGEHLLAVIAAARWTWSRPLPRLRRAARYCHLVAGVVGEVAARTSSAAAGATIAYAPARAGDAAHQHHPRRRRRHGAGASTCRCPMKQFDVKAHEILPRSYSERFTALMRFQAERARLLRRGAGAAARGRSPLRRSRA